MSWGSHAAGCYQWTTAGDVRKIAAALRRRDSPDSDKEGAAIILRESCFDQKNMECAVEAGVVPAPGGNTMFLARRRRSGRALERPLRENFGDNSGVRTRPSARRSRASC